MNHRQLILLAAAGSLSLLAGAYMFQLLGYAPCKLCYWQRWPHAAAVVIALAALGLRRPVLAYAGALAAAVTGGIGIYHTGIERGFWAGPDSCTGADFAGLSAADLLERINNAPLIRCDEVAWELLSLSMASWNALISFGLVLVWLAATRARTPA